MSRYQVEVQLAEAAAAIDSSWLPRLEEAAEATLAQQAVAPPAELTVRLTDNAELQMLNQMYRGFDEPTDVLSFESGETEYLGDIAISVEKAETQAAEANHTLFDELALLTVHGVLHLLGYDHAEEAEKAVMWAAQQAVLDALST